MYMRMKDLEKKNKDELTQLLLDNQNKLRHFRFQIGQGKVKNNKTGRETKKTIARILMRLHAMKS